MHHILQESTGINKSQINLSMVKWTKRPEVKSSRPNPWAVCNLQEARLSL